jgi:TolB-like protein/DNA-binding winged helix-turn-helix (wHTH) protein
MQEADHHPVRLRFGVFEIDLHAGELRKHGLRIRLQEQPFQVLAMLLEHAPEVVTRDELQKKLWPADTFVDFDHGLNKAINKIRDALSDSAESPRFVETVARRGYRFLADVRVVDGVLLRSTEHTIEALSQSHDRGRAGPSGELAAHKRRVLPLAWKISISVLVLFVVILIAWTFRDRNRPSSVIRSLAVLPLESLSGDTSQDYFADGMTDELITDLGQISALRVISRTSVMSYKRARKPLPQIARELNVDAVVEGTVLRSGNQVRITAQLIQASDDKHLWARSYEGDLQDTLALQNQVARAIAEQIRISLNPQEQAALKTVKVVNPQAYEYFLKGRYFWNKRTADGLRVAVAYFS